MLYVLIGEDAPGSLEKRLAARPEHVARLQALQADGRLILAGPCPAIDSPDPGPAGFTGSVIVRACMPASTVMSILKSSIAE